MALDFPASPTDGQVYQNWIYSAAKGAWKAKPLTPAKTLTSDTPPGSPSNGDQWFNTIDGTLYIYVTDVDGSQWVESRAPITADGYYSQNYIINSAFQVNQRNYVSAATLASGSYGFDRWKSGAAGTTLTYTSAPQGQLVTMNSGGVIQQVIERQNISAGIYTLSWKGTATGRVYNFGSTPPSYSDSGVVVTLDGLANVVVEIAAVSADKTLGFAQLESGAVASGFRRNANSIQGELATCQRYYQRITSITANAGLISGHQITTTESRLLYSPAVVFRVVPSISVNLCDMSDDVSFASVVSTITMLSGSSPQAPYMFVTHVASGAAFRPILLRGRSASTSFVEFSAEL
jgi:hypothetical protein